MGNFLVRYASRVIIYNCRNYSRLSSFLPVAEAGFKPSTFWSEENYKSIRVIKVIPGLFLFSSFTIQLIVNKISGVGNNWSTNWVITNPSHCLLDFESIDYLNFLATVKLSNYLFQLERLKRKSSQLRGHFEAERM